MSLLDNIIILFYFAIIIGTGIYYSRKKEHGRSDYFLAGRNTHWVILGISLFAASVSSDNIAGQAAAGASRGIAAAPAELMAVPVLLILGYLFAPLYIKAGVYSVPEFIESKFDRKTRLYLAGISIFTYMFIKISITLFAGSLLLHEILDWDIYTSSLIMVLLAGLYTVAGGLKAVIHTQIFQTVFFIGGSILLTFIGMHEVGGFEGLFAKLPSDYFNIIKPVSDPDFPWTGVLFGAPIIGFWYWCTDQYIVQRVLSARSVHDARRGTIVTSLLKVFSVIVLVLPGLIAFALFHGVKGEQVFPFLLKSRILPIGVKGIIAASILGAIMSTLSGIFISASTLFAMDLYRPLVPDVSERKLVLVGRLSTTIFIVIAVLWVPVIKYISLENYILLQNLQAYIGPPVAALFILGLSYRKINSRGAICGMAAGGFAGLVKLILELSARDYSGGNIILSWFIGINYLHFAVVLFLFSSAVMALVSRFFPEPVLNIERAERFS